MFRVFYADCEIILPKSAVEFKGNLGKFNAVYEDEELCITLVGLVDRNYNLVMNLYPEIIIPKLDILDDNTLIAYVRTDEKDMVCLGDIQSGVFNLELDLNANNYLLINDEVILLETIIDEIPFAVLYNYKKKICLTPYFNYIGKFKYKEEFKEEVAMVTMYLSRDFSLGYIGCYINKEGQILSRYKDFTTNKVYDSIYELDEVLKLVREERL